MNLFKHLKNCVANICRGKWLAIMPLNVWTELKSIGQPIWADVPSLSQERLRLEFVVEVQ